MHCCVVKLPVSKDIKDASVLSRLEFAASYLPKDMPNYLDYVTAFALKIKTP